MAATWTYLMHWPYFLQVLQPTPTTKVITILDSFQDYPFKYNFCCYQELPYNYVILYVQHCSICNNSADVCGKSKNALNGIIIEQIKNLYLVLRFSVHRRRSINISDYDI